MISQKESILSQSSSVKPMIVISVVFLIIYSVVSIVRHFTFQSHAFDLGIFNQAIYNYAHFELGPNTLRGVPVLLADHFELLLFLFAPLYWLFGSYTLLIVQILSIIFGGVGIYLLVAKETNNNRFFTLGTVILFYLSFGIFEAVAFDYHNNVVGTMLLPWILYFLSSKRFRSYYLFLILFLVSKENLALMTVFLGISMLFSRDIATKKHGIITFLLSAAYFILMLKVVIPFLNGGNYDHWSYQAVGQTPWEAIQNTVRHPLSTLHLFFDHPAKLKTWLLVLASGGIFCFVKPSYGILLVPVLAQKFLSDNPFYWGYVFQYSIEFAPIIPLVTALTILRIPLTKPAKVVLVFFIIVNIGILRSIRLSDGAMLNEILSKSYYARPSNIKTFQEAVQIIGNSSVSTTDGLVPHLAGRDEIYLFPTIHDSEYILFNLEHPRVWPFKDINELNAERMKKVDQNAAYQKIVEKDNIVLYKKKS